jgi:hypothetical protein
MAVYVRTVATWWGSCSVLKLHFAVMKQEVKTATRSTFFPSLWPTLLPPISLPRPPSSHPSAPPSFFPSLYHTHLVPIPLPRPPSSHYSTTPPSSHPSAPALLPFPLPRPLPSHPSALPSFFPYLYHAQLFPITLPPRSPSSPQSFWRPSIFLCVPGPVKDPSHLKNNFIFDNIFTHVFFTQ